MFEESPSSSSSQRKTALGKPKYGKLKETVFSKRKKYIAKQQNKHRPTKRTLQLDSLIAELSQNNLIEQEVIDLLVDLGVPCNEQLEKILRKKRWQINAKRFPQELKTFALHLNFFAPKAYKYVKETFDTCLPHPRKISSLYQNSNYYPGFTSQAFLSITHVAATRIRRKFVCNIVLDELQIRKQQIEWDHSHSKSFGFVNFGDDKSENNIQATKILMFMVVCLNGSWKIPVGYFPVASINAEQKKNLLLHCIQNLKTTGVQIAGVTFDGTRENFAMSTLLGCDLFSIQDEYYFETDYNDDKFVIYPDPVQMLKLVRNCLAEHSVFLIGSEKIEWKYIVFLQNLQENENLNLGNKSKKSRIYFKSQRMKVKLAIQTFSKSLADAIDYCRDVLKIEEFKNSHTTADFIRNINDIFDIINSREKTAMNKDNYYEIAQLCNENVEYLQSLQLQNGCHIINSNRKNGFVGLIVCLQNLKTIYDRFIATNVLPSIPTYKLNQNHLSSIKIRLGYNNNPTVKQFFATYKQFVCSQIQEVGIESSLPLEEISALKTSLASLKEITNAINLTSHRHELFDVTSSCSVEVENEYEILDERSYMFNPTDSATNIVEYISGYLVDKLHSQLNCEVCLSLLEGKVSSLVKNKAKVYLKSASWSVVKICEITEKEIRIKRLECNNDTRFTSRRIYNKIKIYCLKKTLCNRNIFSEFVDHPIDHYGLLIRLIVKMYLDVRYYYVTKSVKEKITMRNVLTKVKRNNKI